MVILTFGEAAQSSQNKKKTIKKDKKNREQGRANYSVM